VGGGQLCGGFGTQLPLRQNVAPAFGSPLQQLIPSLTGTRLVVLISGWHWPQLLSGGVMPALTKVPLIRQPGMQRPYSQTEPAQHSPSPPHGL
jgi:hypothetical protein